LIMKLGPGYSKFDWKEGSAGILLCLLLDVEGVLLFPFA